MRVSVAMATYNGMAYLEEQLQSVLCQLGEADELVVSDDGSTDGTWERLQALCDMDKRVKLLQGPRRGVIKNFAYAIEACAGDVIFLCDQDDVWEPDKVKTVLQTFAQTGAAVVMHDACIVNEQGEERLPSFFATRATRTGLLKNLWKNSYIGCCMAVSRRLIPYILPFPDSIPMHDQWIGLQAERHGGVALIAHPLIRYRRHGDNATADTHGALGTMLRQRWGMINALLRRSKR